MTNSEVDDRILAAIKAKMPEIDDLGKKLDDMWGVEDAVYRFYHHSFKVFYAKSLIKEAIALFIDIASEAGFESSEKALNDDFMTIVQSGLEKKFDVEKTNGNWLLETRPIIEAIFHVRYMLSMIASYGKTLDAAPKILPSGWASVLYLYNSR